MSSHFVRCWLPVSCVLHLALVGMVQLLPSHANPPPPKERLITVHFSPTPKAPLPPPPKVTPRITPPATRVTRGPSPVAPSRVTPRPITHTPAGPARPATSLRPTPGLSTITRPQPFAPARAPFAGTQNLPGLPDAPERPTGGMADRPGGGGHFGEIDMWTSGPSMGHGTGGSGTARNGAGTTVALRPGGAGGGHGRTGGVGPGPARMGYGVGTGGLDGGVPGSTGGAFPAPSGNNGGWADSPGGGGTQFAFGVDSGPGFGPGPSNGGTTGGGIPGGVGSGHGIKPGAGGGTGPVRVAVGGGGVRPGPGGIPGGPGHGGALLPGNAHGGPPGAGNWGDTPAGNGLGNDIGDGDGGSGNPTYGAAAISGPTPNYPGLAAKERQAGTVILAVTISNAGAIEKIEIVQRSNSDVLDNEAKRTAAKWKYHSGMTNGKVTGGVVKLQVTFELGKKPTFKQL